MQTNINVCGQTYCDISDLCIEFAEMSDINIKVSQSAK